MKTSVLLVALALTAPAAFAQSAPELLKAKGCLGCHDMEKKKVGLAYKDVAAKYKDDKGAEEKIIGELKSGKGHPVKISASDEELKKLVEHVLSMK